MGYPLDLFLREDIEQEFICAICHDILQNVTMVLSCEHVFCRTCITQWNKSSNTCPVDRKHVRKLRIADFKIPTRCDFIDRVPRNPSCQFLSWVLRGQLWATMDRNVNLPRRKAGHSAAPGHESAGHRAIQPRVDHGG